MNATETVYVVRDASAEYIRVDGARTPCGDQAAEFDTIEQAREACDRATDRVLSREVD